MLGDFRLVREIARGGMGIVHLARQISLGREVAVKVLPGNLIRSAEQVDRFRREAHLLARMKHPFIVPVHAVGRTGDDHWFAMANIDGRSLHEELALARGADGPGTVTLLPGPSDPHYALAAAQLVRRIAEALDHAHRRGVVHCDVNPKNILIDADGLPHLIDFGLAQGDDDARNVRSAQLTGTPHYMSPEQALARSRPVDHRTDVFSLGAVLYELLTRKRPFQGKTLDEVLHEVRFRDPLPVRKLEPRVGRELEVICRKAMAKEARARYGTARELAGDLNRVLERPPRWIDRARRFASFAPNGPHSAGLGGGGRDSDVRRGAPTAPLLGAVGIPR